MFIPPEEYLRGVKTFAGMGALIVTTTILLSFEFKGLWIIGVGLGSVFFAMSAFKWYRYRVVSQRDRRVVRSKREQELNKAKVELLNFAVAGPLLSVWVFYALRALETQQTSSVPLWIPVALMYNLLGFWPAVLFIPCLTAIVIVSWVRKIRVLSSKDSKGRP